MSTGLSSIGMTSERTSAWARLADYVELTKPRIVLLELVAVVIALHAATSYGAPGSQWSIPLMLAVALGTGLVAGSANAINQWLERELDAKMSRTRTRPLPSGRVTPAEALLFGLLTLAMGVSTLAMIAGLMPALVAIGTWAVYVGVYTPLKTRSWTNTAVGAVSGATPLLIGWTAGGAGIDSGLAIALAATMYVWQFPHFMAIAWICREDYAVADYKMSTTLDPSGHWAGVQAVVGSAVLLPVSLMPLFVSSTISAPVYAIPVALVGLMMLRASARFMADRNEKSAKHLMRASLIYVPVWLLAFWFAGA